MRPARRLSPIGMIGIVCGLAGAFIGYKASAQTVAITNGTVVLGDGSEPIQGGTVVVRNGRIVRLGGSREWPAWV